MKPKRGEYGPVAMFGFYDDDEDGKAIVYLEGHPGSDKTVIVLVPLKLLTALPFEGWAWPELEAVPAPEKT